MDFLKPKDIRLWIILFFMVRMYGIIDPPIEIVHNWRQTTVTMVARNFYEIDPQILYPRIDIAGEKTGITGMEFPVLNYLIYLFSEVFGYQHWYGRLINLLVSCFGIWYFFKLIKLKFNEQIAFNASIVLLFSIWYTYSRKIMPDTFSMSLIIAGLYHSIRYLDKDKWLHLLYACLLIGIGTLSKLPSAYLLIVLLIPILSGPVFTSRKIWLNSALLVTMIFPAWYYFKWVPYLTNHYGFQHFFMGKSMLKGGKELLDHLPETIGRFYDTAIKYIGFAMLIFGIVTAIRKKEFIITKILFLGFIGFLPIMLKGGFTFYHHSYYIIPFVPVMAFVSGFGIQALPSPKVRYIVLIAIGLEGFFNHMDDFRIKSHMKPILQLESIMDSYSKRDELILINSGEFPTPMYFAHRKGWVDYRYQIERKYYIDSLTNKGLKHIVILKRAFGETFQPGIDSSWNKVHDDEDYKIYSKRH